MLDMYWRIINMTKEVFNALNNVYKKINITDLETELLINLGYINGSGEITKEGYNALEPYRVKRAIIMAAGFGSRMVPITLTTPKPLVRVNGVRFIDTLLSKIIKAGIGEVIIIRGYLKDKFDDLLKDYPFIKFVDNDDYNKENNISSVIKVLEYLPNSYLCEADFFVEGDDVIETFQYESNYLSTPVEITDDWCFDVDSGGNLVNYRKGGKNCLQAFGISYWNKDDGNKLIKYLKEMYSHIENRQNFWEMCIFEDYKEKFEVKPRIISFDSIVEIDSFDELVKLDKSYLNLKNK